MASQFKVFVDWSSIPIWCCGKSFIGEEISKHSEEKHNKPDCAVNDKRPRIKSKEALVKVNVDEDDKNNNSIPIVNNEKSEILLEKKKSDNKKYYCDKCLYTAKRKSSLTMHIENRHLLGIRHECEVCQYLCTSKNSLLLHRTRKHSKKASEQDAITTAHNSSQNENMDVSEIKPEIVTPPHVSDIDEIKRDIEIPPPPPEVQNVVAEIKQEIDDTSPAISDNHNDDIPAEVFNGEVPVPIEVKEEVDEVLLQVPGFRTLSQFEPPLLEDRNRLKAAEREVDHEGVEEQINILKFHSKLEKEEKRKKKRDARWWKRLAEIQKLQEAKDRDIGKIVKQEGEDIELLWPNEDLITDLVIVDVRDDTVQNTEGDVDDMEVVRDDLDQSSGVILDSVELDADAVRDNEDVAAANMGQNSLSSESQPSK